MSGSRNGAEVVVVGGGVVGLAVAREAGARGADVLVLERGRAGREASWAAAGMLSPLGEALEPGAFLRFGLRSLRMWARFAATLEEETGVGLEYREEGKLRLAGSPAEEERLRACAGWARTEGVPVRWLDPDEARRREPALADGLRGGLLLEADYRVENRALGRALALGARERGVELREGAEVRRVVHEEDRVRSVELADGSRIEADQVVLAAGAWTGRIAGLPRPVPVRPVRGQMLSLRPSVPPSRRVLETGEIYLVPRADGRVLAGATVEDVGFAEGTTAAGVRDVLDAALRLVPALAGAPVVELWSGFRPGSPDGVPILGAHPRIASLWIATGHFRNGILLAPATAEAVVGLLRGDPSSGPPPEFSPARFLRSGSGHLEPHPQESGP